MDVDPAEAVPNNDEDDDPVVEEIPVYLSKSVNCYLFQYPVRPATLSYDNSQVTRARFRPSNKQVQLEIKLNTNSENYDQSKGEQIAINTDGCGSSSEKYFKSNRMDKQVLVGQSGGCGSGRYSVAKLTEDRQLHLTEIQGILQVRPSLNYMDKSDRIAKQEGKFKDEPDDPDMEEEKPQAVTVRFSRGDSDRAQKMKEKSYDYQMKRVEEEPWVECDFNSSGSDQCREVCRRMKCRQPDNSLSSSLSQSHKDYLSDLKDSHG